MIRKIFRVYSAFVERIKFFRFFVVVFFVITLNEITMFNRNTEKKIQNERDFSLKENSNDVESSHSNVFLSSLSFDYSKSNDQKNLNSFDNFSIVEINWKTMFIRIWCKFCARCAKMTIFYVFHFESINCQRCEKNKNECVSINFYIFKNFQKLFFYWSKRCFNIIEKRSHFSFLRECDCAISKRRVSIAMFFFLSWFASEFKSSVLRFEKYI